MSDADLQNKYGRMCEIIRSLERVAVAFSAGVDSTLVLKVAADVLGPSNVLAVTGNSDSLARAEFAEAKELADAFGVEHIVVDTTEFESEDYLANPKDRCYHCKNTLYAEMKRLLSRRGISQVVNGINADDYGDWRPGIRAAREHGVRSPVAEAGLTKADIRALSREMGLPTFDKPAMPCLASRVPYGQRITPEKLRMIERGEAFLRELGFPECRVRHHENLARIEVPPERIAELTEPSMRRKIVGRFRDVGYAYVTLDLQGFRSGSLNEVIAAGKGRPAT